MKFPLLKSVQRRLFSFLVRPFLTSVFPIFAYSLLRLILFTCRKESQGLESFLEDTKEKGALLAVWHNRLLLLPYFGGVCTPQIPYTAVISNSHDGEPLAKITASFKNASIIRVAHNARAQALKAIVQSLKKKQVVIITPDGPRGPVYQAKTGTLYAAANSSSNIYPFSWTASHYWELNTWDRMRIPRPFSKIKFFIGKPYRIESEKKLRSWEKETKNLEDVLNKL